jgi:MtN3 and saliva related transmembrane protein
MYSGPVELIGLLAGAITSAGFLPQLFKGFKTKKLDDVSYFMPFVLAIGMSIWFYYGYLIESIAVMVANAFSISCCIILITMKRKYL